MKTNELSLIKELEKILGIMETVAEENKTRYNNVEKKYDFVDTYLAQTLRETHIVDLPDTIIIQRAAKLRLSIEKNRCSTNSERQYYKDYGNIMLYEYIDEYTEALCQLRQIEDQELIALFLS